MKNISKIFGMLVVAALATIGFSACSDDNVVEEVAASANGESDKVEVSINLGGEIATSTGTMTRADYASNDLYNILIEDVSTGNVYAYGVFDGNNLGNMVVSLDRDDTYNIQAGMIRDAKNKIYHKEETRYVNNEEITDIKYWDPYWYYEGDINKFIYCYNDNFTYESPSASMNLASVESPEENYQDFGLVDRYYGKYDGYTPTENGSFTVNLLRMSFQLVLNVSNLDDGETLTLTNDNLPDIVITSDKPYNGDAEGEGEIYMIPTWRFESVVDGEAYDQWFSFSLKWTNANGEEKTLKPNLRDFSINVNRMKKYTVNITLSEFVAYDNTATITIDESEIIDGDAYTLDETGLNEKTESNGEE